MKIKIWSFLIVSIVCVLCLGSCESHNDIRPGIDPNEVWVCEYPFAYFKFDEEMLDSPGKLIYNDKEYDFFEDSGNGLDLSFRKPEAYKGDDVFAYPEFTYLHGFADYQEGYFIYSIKNDYDNIFDGEITEMLFTKYTVAEFEEKFGELRLDAKFPEYESELE